MRPDPGPAVHPGPDPGRHTERVDLILSGDALGVGMFFLRRSLRVAREPANPDYDPSQLAEGTNKVHTPGAPVRWFHLA